MPIGYVYVGPQGDINQTFINLIAQINAEFADINAYPPGGADTQVQYNHQGSFAGIPGMAWSGTDLTLPQIAAPGVTFSDGTTQNIAVRQDQATPFMTRAGFGALAGTSATDNTAFGWGAGNGVTSNGDCTFVGYKAGFTATGAQHTVVGSLAGSGRVMSLTRNTLIGYNAGLNISTGGENTIVGAAAMAGATVTGAQNTAVGSAALNNCNSGTKVSAVGYASLLGNNSGARNSALGWGAGYQTTAASATNALTTANNCTFLGEATTFSTTTQRDYTTVIGSEATAYDAANTVTIGRIGTDNIYTGPAVIGMATVTTYYTIGTLPTPTAALKGARAFVTDGLVATGFGNAVAGTGAVLLPVICDGISAWLYG